MTVALNSAQAEAAAAHKARCEAIYRDTRPENHWLPTGDGWANHARARCQEMACDDE